ncbi:MAG: translation initiation factor IF-3 [Minisyncoccia bacterium]
MIKELKINEQIKSPTIQLIDENGRKLGNLPINKALEVASDRQLDLVEVSSQSNPPVCKLMDYGKYRYQQIKKEKEQKKRNKQKETKTIRLSLRIEQHDLNVKIKKAQNFLEKKHPVKVVLILKGREITHQDNALKIINQFAETIKNLWQAKEGPKQERNIIQLFLIPK